MESAEFRVLVALLSAVRLALRLVSLMSRCVSGGHQDRLSADVIQLAFVRAAEQVRVCACLMLTLMQLRAPSPQLTLVCNIFSLLAALAERLPASTAAALHTIWPTILSFCGGRATTSVAKAASDCAAVVIGVRSLSLATHTLPCLLMFRVLQRCMPEGLINDVSAMYWQADKRNPALPLRQACMRLLAIAIRHRAQEFRGLSTIKSGLALRILSATHCVLFRSE